MLFWIEIDLVHPKNAHRRHVGIFHAWIVDFVEEDSVWEAELFTSSQILCLLYNLTIRVKDCVPMKPPLDIS
jgi:hypothetical protein